jgi:hypothetical protein
MGITLTPFSEDRPRLFTALLCDGWTARGVTSLPGLVAILRDLQAQSPACRILATLDDPRQAAYTSGHTIGSHNLDRIDRHDLSALPPEAFENGAHVGYLSTPAEFPIRLANLLEQVKSTSLKESCGLLAWAQADSDNGLITANTDPDAAMSLVTDGLSFIQRVPVARAADALAAFPNGYFTCDLNPMQTHALACYLEEAHGLSLFGVGASWLGFWRDTPIDAPQAQALAKALTRFYAETPTEAAAAFATMMTGRDVLIVRYTES